MLNCPPMRCGCRRRVERRDGGGARRGRPALAEERQRVDRLNKTGGGVSGRGRAGREVGGGYGRPGRNGRRRAGTPSAPAPMRFGTGSRPCRRSLLRPSKPRNRPVARRSAPSTQRSARSSTCASTRTDAPPGSTISIKSPHARHSRQRHLHRWSCQRRLSRRRRILLQLPRHHIDAREARCRLCLIARPRQLTANTARQLLTPGVELSRCDTVPVNDLARSDARSQALRDDLPLLLDRPPPPPLATRDQLDPLRASGHMTTLMTAP